MKVIVIGNGGREHAIAWKLAQSMSVSEIICVPGNGGTAHEAKCRNVSPSECDYIGENASFNEAVVQIARHEGCTMAVIGPEDPLAAGIADAFWAADIPTVGVKQAGAQLEASKHLAKAFMAKYGVACAKSATFNDKNKALEYIEANGAPIVIKADGLAAGKGVVVALTLQEARDAITDLMENGRVGAAGSKVVIEEYLRGTEISILAAVSVTPESAKAGNATILPFLPSRDHKRLCEGAKGPNTGGMGAICPVDDVTPLIQSQFEKNILQPTLRGLVEEGYDYRGFIFFGIMLTEDGPKCLEYNVRLGDPETQAVLPLMNFDFERLCESIINGDLNKFKLEWKKGYVVAPVAVSGGYPREYKKGLPIFAEKHELETSGAKVFIAGAIADRRSDHSTREDYTGLVTSGGRVLACSAYGDKFDDAWNKAYNAMRTISFDGMFYRKDIGLPGAAEST
ncbi:MAG: phosphoribosylamine--glycine ligase [Treponema sp.]|nr:phosphoribosylamine--glycine ligase [Treponema sp.]